MKGKLAVVTALATIVTVGGVYATWTFSEGDVINADTTINVAMTGASNQTEKGTLSVKVMGENGFTLAVDDANNDHYADILKTGVITVTFTPSSTASEEVKTTGIDVQLVLSYAPYTNGPATLEDWTYNGAQIFTISNDSTNPIHLDKADAVNVSGVFTWTIAAADVGIALGDTFDDILIDTKAKYDEVNAELAKGHFVATVSECETVHTP